jgi:hypothetical protein
MLTAEEAEWEQRQRSSEGDASNSKTFEEYREKHKAAGVM